MTKKQINKKVGKNLKALRKAARVTQMKLGRRLRIPQHGLCKIEKGSRFLTAAELYRAAKFFEVDLDVFFEWGEDGK